MNSVEHPCAPENVHSTSECENEKELDEKTKLLISNLINSFTLLDLVNSEEMLKTCTGIPTYSKFEALCQAAEKVMIHLNIRHKYDIDVNCMVFLTLVKLKMNPPFAFLAGSFRIASSTAKKYFAVIIAVFHIMMEPFIKWFDSDSIKDNLPKVFYPYPNTVAVIDCTEFPTEMPSCLVCRNRLYSTYKSRHTAKLLLAVTPSGVIIVVGNLFGGRAGDKSMFAQSSILKKCLPGEALMVDRGFQIKDLCLPVGVEVIQPPFKPKNRRFDFDEAQCGIQIARARIHIERVNARIKEFAILQKIPTSLFDMIDEIVFVICGLVNLQNPVLGNASF